MAFDTPNGTRGARQAGRDRIERWGNQRMAERLRRKGDRRGNKLVLVTVGKKTGVERMTPGRWFPGEGETRLIVASAPAAHGIPRGTTTSPPTPDRVRTEFAGQRIEVTPEQRRAAASGHELTERGRTLPPMSGSARRQWN